MMLSSSLAKGTALRSLNNIDVTLYVSPCVRVIVASNFQFRGTYYDNSIFSIF